MYLEDVSDMIQVLYRDKFDAQSSAMWGQTTNKVFRHSNEIVKGQGQTVQVEIGPADSVRFNTNMLGAFATSQRLKPYSYNVRWSETGTCDFVRVSASCTATEWDIKNAGGGLIEDFVMRTYRQIDADYEEKLAIHRNIGRTARLALVNGTAKLNNSQNYTDATGTATNAGGARVAFDAGSRAYFRPNARVDFYSSAGVLHAGNILVTDINRADSSIGLSFSSGGPAGENSTGDLSTVADNDEIFFAGERNAGMYSMGAYFGMPSSGDSFIGGVDRTSANARWMIPTATRAEASTTSAKITKSMFNTLGEAMGYIDEDGIGGVFQMCPEVHNTLRDEIGEQSFIQLPINDDRMKRFAHFGSVGLVYQHPTFGVTQFVADPLAPSTEVRFIVPETWVAMYYAWKGLEKMPGDGGRHWYRMNEAVPNTGRSLVWKADWLGTQLDLCTMPWKNGVIKNISAT